MEKIKAPLVSILPESEINDSDTFRKYHNELLEKYGVTFENNTDAWFATDGNIYRKDDVFVCHITGIYYDKEGNWDGDLDGYLRLLESELFQSQKHETKP